MEPSALKGRCINCLYERRLEAFIDAEQNACAFVTLRFNFTREWNGKE